MYRLAFLSIIFLTVFSSCEKEPLDEIIPFSFVNMDINLNLIQYQDLRNLGGYVYITEGSGAGYRGIIIYHEGNGVYKAFERACTFDPHADCSPVEIDDSGLFMTHKCCKSSFNFHGNPTGGPASLNLLQYSTYLDGIYLKIRNN